MAETDADVAVLAGMPEDTSQSWRPVPPSESSDKAEAYFRETRIIDSEATTDGAPVLSPSKRLETTTSPAEPAHESLEASYHLRRVIGQGGQGEIWQAVQVVLDRQVAVKRIRSKWYEGQSKETIRSLEIAFKKEALVAGQLEHPTIVPIYDLGADRGGRPLLAMKLVQGENWHELLLRDREMPIADFLAKHLPILVRVAHAVAFAHSRGVIHRDLKPAQVMVGGYGAVFLMDWGLAMVLDKPKKAGSTVDTISPLPFTRNEVTNPAGTVCFMAPEQTRHSTADLGTHTDIFLLGGMLYFILTLTPPHDHKDAQIAFAHARDNTVEPPGKRAPDREIPAELSRLCMRALERRIADRLGSVQEFITGIEDFLAGRGRRAESQELTQQVRESLSDTATYEQLSQFDFKLTNALNLWPENHQARELQQQLVRQIAESAVAHGDFSLARVASARLANSDLRATFSSRISRAEEIRHRQAVQRKLAVRSAFVLVVMVAVLGFLFIGWWVSMRQRQAGKAVIAAQAEEANKREMQREQDAAKQARLWESISTWRKEEAELAKQFATELKDARAVPATFRFTAADKLDWEKMDHSAINAMLAQKRRLDEERNSIRSAEFDLELPPFNVSFGAGLMGLRQAGNSTATLEAYQDLRQSHEAEPDRYVALVQMAVAGQRAGNLTSASAHLIEAAKMMKPRFGFRDQYQAILTLVAEIEILKSKSVVLSPDAVIVRPRPEKGKRFRTISGNWGDSDKPPVWSRSAAPGLASLPSTGTLMCRFYSPFRPLVPDLPAVARYYPKVTQPTHYFVYATWPMGGNASPVKYEVRDATSDTTVSVSQDGWGGAGELNGNKWVPLGEHVFNPGEEQYVELRLDDDAIPLTPDWNGQVQADAMLFSPVPLSGGTAEPAVRKLDVSWRFSAKTAEADAARLHKKIFLLFACPSHPHTIYFGTEVLGDLRIREIIEKNYVPLWLHPHGNSEDAQRYEDSPIGEIQICDSHLTPLKTFDHKEVLPPSLLLEALLEDIGGAK